MRGYDRDEYEGYEDYDDYEEDDGEGEYEEEEQRKPSAEELEYLELRERLKERFRRKMLKQKGASAGSKSQEIKKKSDGFGSFFGPSQPVIAQRVIQESKTLLENPHLAVKALNSRNEKKASLTGSGSGSGSKNGVNEQISRVRKELHTKVQKLKDTRDYSFLLSDDAELPAPAKQPVPRNVTVPKAEARSVQVPQKSRQLSSSSVRDSQGGREERKPIHMNGQMHPKSGAQRPNSVSKTSSNSVDSRRQLSSSNGIGPGRPAGPKGLAPKMPLASGERKVSAPAPKAIAPATRKPLPPKMQSSVPRQHAEQKRPLQEPRKSVAAPKQPPMQKQPPTQRQLPPTQRQLPPRKQPVAPSRPQINRPMKPVSPCPPLHDRDNRPRKRPARPFPDEDDDDMEAFAMLRQMTRSDRWRNVDDDDDLSDMEANFDQILKEENYSTRIARREDEEQLKLIMEEERREEERRRAKKRKLMQQR